MQPLSIFLQTDIPSGMWGIFYGAMFFQFLLAIVMIAGMWKTFKKAGYEGWEAIIPFYNFYIITKISQRPMSYFWIIAGAGVLFMMGSMLIQTSVANFGADVNPIQPLPMALYCIGLFVMLFFMAKIYKSVALNFGKNIFFAIGLLFLPFIFWPILGFGSAQYLPNSTLEQEIDNIGTWESPR